MNTNTFKTSVFDENDVEHLVEVDYHFITNRSGTHFEPSEGGCEIEDIRCETLDLSDDQLDVVYVECCEHACREYSNSVTFKN